MGVAVLSPPPRPHRSRDGISPGTGW
jgi:hypothetical protein